MDGIYLISKRVGESMGQLVERFRSEQNVDVEVSITFAGRLDPLAEGLCILLVGSFVYEKEKYLAYDKTYTGTFVTGISTDTYDITGIPKVDPFQEPSPSNTILAEIENWKIYMSQEYPMYSSKPVDGKPLWMWARDEQIPPSGIPSRTISVSESSGEYVGKISMDELCNEVKNLLALFPAGFRQHEIGEAWNSLESVKDFGIYQFSVTVSSGTYVRGLVHTLGENSDSGAALKTLIRTRIGPFQLSDELRAGKASKINI
ncbi:MAG: hypothetical protein KBC98_01830 [Candidatus Pacebacteria bacterium]|nr:hypothetical protein [Candidatus Paceibacterota bacterium]